MQVTVRTNEEKLKEAQALADQAAGLRNNATEVVLTLTLEESNLLKLLSGAIGGGVWYGDNPKGSPLYITNYTTIEEKRVEIRMLTNALWSNLR